MAEQIPFSIAEKILTKLGSLAVQEIELARDVRKELAKLVQTLTTINAVLLDAEERQEGDHAVQNWVRRFKDVIYDADDLLDDFTTYELGRGGMARQVSRFFSSSNQVAFHFRMGHRIKDIRGRLDDIANDISKFNFIRKETTSIRVENKGRETHSFVLTSEIMGRDEDKKKIIELLLQSKNEENLSVVAIVGIDGLGKTALAQLVYNDEKVVKHFDLRLWVCVSDDFDVKILARNIIKSGFTDANVDTWGLEQLKEKLHEKLNSKRYLLVLDDVWNDNFEKWNQLRILLKVGVRGSKVVVTTRSSKVASTMGIDFPYILKGLNESQSWALFKSIAFGEDQQKAHPQLLTIGEKITERCNGVPLVIRTLGRILHSKTEESQWLSILNNKNLVSLQDGNSILFVLKLSYDDLPSHLKQCFTYCALFPKHYEIKRKMLIQLWMAQGYIQPFDEHEHLEDVGDQYFRELLSRSMFQEVKIDDNNNILSCKMHDLVHDLAQILVKSEIFILTNDVNTISERIHHVSILEWSQRMKVLKGKSIRTLFIHSNCGFDPCANSMVNTLVLNCKCLRALDLCRGTKPRKLPESIVKLGHLRYLDLSCGRFEVLPTGITSLQNLQTLKLWNCDLLKELPRNIRKMINLRHLEIHGCYGLNYMPCRLGELTMLQTLPLFIVGKGDIKGIGRLNELKCLNNLRGGLQIIDLERVKGGALESREANLKEKHYLQSLRLQWGWRWGEANQNGELVMEGLQPHPNLKELCIDGYTGVRFASWMSSMLPSLQPLDPRDVNALEYMLENSSSVNNLPGEQAPFPSLSKLYIRKCHQLTTFQLLSFPHLSELHIQDCRSLESLQLPSLPSLSKLHIHGCGQLTTFQLLSSPHLSKLHIWDCRTLQSLQLPSFPSLSKLEIKGSYGSPNFGLYSSLDFLELHSQDCRSSESLQLPTLPPLSKLDISGCNQLTTFQLLSSPHLSELRIRGCRSLETLQLPSFPSLSKLYITRCAQSSTTFKPFSSPHLSELHINRCWSLEPLQLLSFPSLTKLYIQRCDQSTTFEPFSSPHLSELHIKDCRSLETLRLPSFPSLSKLHICSCGQLTAFQLLSSPHLSELVIRGCRCLESLQLPSLPCLEELNLLRVREKILWQIILASSSLKSLYISKVNDMVSLPDDRLQHLTSLKSLQIEDCDGLVSLFQGIQHLGALEELRISECMQLNLSDKEDDDGGGLQFQGLRSLRQLFLTGIPKLVSLPTGLQHVTTLETLTIFSCHHFTTLPDWIGSLTSLLKLKISWCRRFKLEDRSKIAHIPTVDII